MRMTLGSMLLAGLLSGCAAARYPIDAGLSCNCAPTDQREQEIVAIAESSGYVRDPRGEGAWPGSAGRRVTRAYFTLKSSSDIDLTVVDYEDRLLISFKIKRYYSAVTDAENDVLLHLESRLAQRQPHLWTERRFDFKVGDYVDRPL